MAAGSRVLVVGDVMLDLATDARRVCWVSEGLRLDIGDVPDRMFPGGAANTAANLAALGHSVCLLGIAGGDIEGAQLQSLCEACGVVSHLSQTGTTTTKHRLYADGRQFCRLDRDRAALPQDEEHVLQALTAVSEVPAAVVVSDYVKGAVGSRVAAAVMSRAADWGVPVFVDTKVQQLDVWRGCSLLKVNLAEALQVLSGVVHPGLAALDSVEQAQTAARLLQERYAIHTVVVTAAEHGACWATQGQSGTGHVGAVSLGQPVRDVAGAGDVVLAVVVSSLLRGDSMETALRHAMTAAAEAVRAVGTWVGSWWNIFRGYCREDSGYKIVEPSRAKELLQVYRRQFSGAKVVLANGCFDGLHAGHLSLFSFAAARGDLLCVAVNDDESLRQLKGVHRPRVPRDLRLQHVAGVPAVDMVWLFDGDVERMVRWVLPDVLVKGADVQGIPPGAEFVQARGGEVALAPTDEFYLVLEDRPTAS